MRIKKRIKKNGKSVYDVIYRTAGRGSRQRPKTFDRKADAKEFVVIKQDEFRKQMLGEVGFSRFEETTFQKKAMRWLEYGKIKFSASHYKRFEGILNNDLLPEYGTYEPRKFSPELIHDIQLKMEKVNNRIKGETRKNASVNRILEVLVAILNYAVAQKRIPYNLAKGYSKLPNDANEMLYWEPEEANDFLTFLNEKFPTDHDDRWVYTAMLTSLSTGLRANELWALDPQAALNLKFSMLIKRQWDSIEKKFTVLKGKRNKSNRNELPFRHVPKPQLLHDELETLIRNRNISNAQTVFGSSYGVRNHDSFVNRYERLIKEWGGRRILFHDLRHTAITLWAHNRCKPKVIQEVAGHEDLKMTMKYIHLVGGSVEPKNHQMMFFVKM